MENINPEKLNELLHDDDHNEVLIDVREPSEYNNVGIPGAENIPVGEIANAVERLKQYGTVYVHCGSGVRSAKACSILKEHGVNVVNMEGGLRAWQQCGLEVRGNGNSITIIRQVMLVAGLLVLAGVALACLVHPYWIGLSALVGAGLTFSGATGNCLMAYLLEKMWWNK